MALFHAHLRSVHGSLQHWNQRWKTSFESWEAMRPPGYIQGGEHYDRDSNDLLYWDFQHFRQQRLHAVHENCCMRAAAHGFKCVLHFGEFLGSNDAICAGGVVFTLAASPWVDYIIVDSNFQTTTGHQNDVRVVQLLISAMKPFRKPVYFEGAFERFRDKKLHQAAVDLTVASGAYGVGFTNWLEQTEPTFFKDTLDGHLARQQDPVPLPSLDQAPPVAILTPYRSYFAFKGFQLANGSMLPNDAQQDKVFQCLDVVQKAVPSLERLEIFGVPAMLMPVLQNFEQGGVWYIQPDHLLVSDDRVVRDLEQQANELGVPFHHCAVRETPPTVLPDCCPMV